MASDGENRDLVARQLRKLCFQIVRVIDIVGNSEGVQVERRIRMVDKDIDALVWDASSAKFVDREHDIEKMARFLRCGEEQPASIFRRDVKIGAVHRSL